MSVRRQHDSTLTAELAVNYVPVSKSIHHEPQGAHIFKSTITARGQKFVPAESRRMFNLSASDGPNGVVGSQGIRVVPVRRDPVAAFRGSGRGSGAANLLVELQADRSRERSAGCSRRRALLTLRDDEPGAPQVAELLQQALKQRAECHARFISLMELAYRAWRHEDEQAARGAYAVFVIAAAVNR